MREKSKEPEFHPDAWTRFERAAGVVAKSPPQHRTANKTKKATTVHKTKRKTATQTKQNTIK
jgi:hypothetical protein